MKTREKRKRGEASKGEMRKEGKEEGREVKTRGKTGESGGE